MLRLAIPSSGRPGHAEKFANVLGDASRLEGGGPLWFVPPEEVEDYRAAGVYAVGLGTREGAGRARNAILDYVGDNAVAMSDDDLKKVMQVEPATGKKWEVSLVEALISMYDRLMSSDMRLIGAAPTNNAYFSKRTTSVNLFAKSGLWVVRPSDLRLDEKLRVKEDYDFNLQHYREYGGWLRADDILATHEQRTKSGGCAPLREAGADEQAVEYLLEKWPGLVRKHSTRENEVTLTVPKRRKTA